MIIRRRRTRNYTILENEVFDDERLSIEAMGLLGWLRSRPDNWSLSVEHARTRFKVGRNKMHDIVRELVEAGWVIRERKRDPETKAFVGIEYVVLDEPQHTTSTGPRPGNQDVASEKAEQQEGPNSVEPRPDLPDLEKPPLANGDDVISTDLEQKPPLPPCRGDGRGISRRDRRQEDPPLDGPERERFDRLWRSYPPDPAMSRLAAERAFRKLAAVDQEAAASHAARYGDDCRSRGRKVMGLARWLRDRVFEGYAKQTAGHALTTVQVWVIEGTAQWEAWSRTKPRGFPTTMAADGKSRGWYFPSEWPPGDERARRVQPSLPSLDLAPS